MIFFFFFFFCWMLVFDNKWLLGFFKQIPFTCVKLRNAFIYPQPIRGLNKHATQKIPRWAFRASDLREER